MYETTNEDKIDGQMNIDQLAGKVESKSSDSQPSTSQTSTPTVNTASKPVGKEQKGKNERQSLAGFNGNIKRMDVNALKKKHILPLKKLAKEYISKCWVM